MVDPSPCAARWRDATPSRRRRPPSARPGEPPTARLAGYIATRRQASQDPHLPVRPETASRSENAVRARSYARAGARASRSPPPRSQRATAAQEPLCDWLLSLGRAAQAQAERDFAEAEAEARRALRAAAPRPRRRARERVARPRARREGRAGARRRGARGRARIARARAAPPRLRARRGAPRRRRRPARGAPLRGSRPRRRARGRRAPPRSARRRRSSRPASRPRRSRSSRRSLRRAPDAAAGASARLALGAGAPRARPGRARRRRPCAPSGSSCPTGPRRASPGDALASWRAAGGPVPPESGADHAARAERLLAAARPEEALIALDAAAPRRRARGGSASGRRCSAPRAVLALGRHADAERLALPLAGARDEGVQRGARLVLARAAARAGRVEEASRFHADVGPDARRDPRAPGVAAAGRRRTSRRSSPPGSSTTRASTSAASPRSRRSPGRTPAPAEPRTRSGSRRGRGTGSAASQDADRAFARLARGPARRRRALLAGAARPRARRAAGAVPLRARHGRRRLVRAALAHPARARSARRRAARRARAARPLPEVLDAWAGGRLSVAVELLGLGLRDEALAELRELSRSGRVRAAAPLVAQLAAFAGDYEMPFRLARDHLPLTRRTVRWLYPEPLPELLGPAARRFGVDPALVLAVMRRESSFRTDARSVAGAEGLLQLRPATAERLAALLGVPRRRRRAAAGAGDRDPARRALPRAPPRALRRSRARGRGVQRRPGAGGGLGRRARAAWRSTRGWSRSPTARRGST